MNGEQTIPELEERIVFLTMERRAAMEALEVALDISSFTASLTGIESVEEILRESAVKIRALLPFEALAFFLADEDDDMALAPAYADPPEKMHVIEQEKKPLIDDRTVAWALRRKKPVIVATQDRSGRIFLHALASPSRVLGLFIGILGKEEEAKQTPSYPDFLSIVLSATSGVIGTNMLLRKINLLNLALQEKVHFLEKSKEELSLYRNNLEREVAARTKELARTNEDLRREIVERKRMEAEIRYRAWHDALTGLANRELFHSRLLEAVAKGEPIAVFFMDLDGFKNINDTLGHDSGDSLLQEAARRIAREMGEENTVARMGGDEFTVIISSPTSWELLAECAKRLLQGISEPISLEGASVSITASIGISRFPEDGATTQDLMKCADVAMYKAKERGKNRYCFWSDIRKK
jgi:diguanylate cyclase (GGDEF)-like protein